MRLSSMAAVAVLLTLAPFSPRSARAQEPPVFAILTDELTDVYDVLQKQLEIHGDALQKELDAHQGEIEEGLRTTLDELYQSLKSELDSAGNSSMSTTSGRAATRRFPRRYNRCTRPIHCRRTRRETRRLLPATHGLPGYCP